MTDDLNFYDFGPFRLNLTERLLFREGEAMALSPKAFETLLVLVGKRGHIVEKDELLKSVWPDTYVSEATLAQNIFTLRKALGGSEGEQYIQTIPKRGYRFVASVTQVTGEGAVVSVDQDETVTDGTLHSESVGLDKEIRSLAVLPMVNETNDKSIEYLSDGITEGIVNNLSLLPEVKIVACSTVRRYKGQQVDVQDVGRELGVDAVLIGRMLHFGENVTIRMELVEVINGFQIWGEEYTERFPDTHQIQARVAKSVSENLRLKVTKEWHERIFKPRTHNAEAFEFYLKGRAFLNTRTKQGYKNAIDCFEQGIDIDPTFALAYSGLADSYVLFDFYGLKSPGEMVPRARRAATMAVELDNELSEAHTSMGAIKLVYDRDLAGAEQEYKRALRLNPNYSHAHDGYAHCLMEMGQIEKSLAECKRALELEPFDLEINQHLGWCYLLAGELDRAIEQFHKTLAMSPDFYRARILLGIAYGLKREFSQAILHYLQASVIEKTPVLSGFLGYAYAMAGAKEAQEVLDNLLEESKRHYVPPYSIALIYTGLGKHTEAIEWLQKAMVEHSHWRGWFALIPELDSLRSDSRFTELLRLRFKEVQY